MNYHNALLVAERISTESECDQYINASVIPASEGMYPILDPTGYQVSDWFISGSTVARFYNGKQRDVD